LEDIAILMIKKYIEKFYEMAFGKFETENLTYKTAEEYKEQLLFPFTAENKKRYIIQIKKDEKELIAKIKELVKNLNKLYKEENDELPRVYMDEHLFLPILIRKEKIDKITPEGLEKSEEDFIKGLREYLKRNKEMFKNFEIYLLRNFPKSGMGFQLQWSKFFPDFIMWIKKKNEQIIVFLEPHGLEHSKGLNDEKIIFATSSNDEIITIKKIEDEVNRRENKNIRLEYFLLSTTKYEDLKRGVVNFPKQKEFEEKNVLFLCDDKNWPEKLFKKIGIIR
jgi:hypothetical protein